jgi:uncharacterized protein (DUF433 family)
MPARGIAMTAASSVVHSDPDILGGTLVFVGTRVPVRTLMDYLQAGDSLADFLDAGRSCEPFLTNVYRADCGAN